MKNLLIVFLTTLCLFSCDRRGSDKDAGLPPTPAGPGKLDNVKPGQNIDNINVKFKFSKSEKDLILSSLKSLPYQVADPTIKELEKQTSGTEESYAVELPVKHVDIILAGLQEQVYKFSAGLINKILEDSRAQVDRQAGSSLSKPDSIKAKPDTSKPK